MKRPDQSWAEYLQEGVAYMEGTTPEDVRSFSRAAAIFEQCAQQDGDLTVQAEGHFRRAQVAHYQKQTDVAQQWIKSGKLMLHDGISPEKRAQCRLVEGIVLEDQHCFVEAVMLYDELWQVELRDQKLRGDIANRMARLVTAHFGPVVTRQACEWIMRAEKCFSSIEEPDANTYHALAAVKSRAALLLHRRSRELWHEAGQLLADGTVRDPFIRATYWLHRSKVALFSLQPLRASWFFLRFLWSYKDRKSR